MGTLVIVDGTSLLRRLFDAEVASGVTPDRLSAIDKARKLAIIISRFASDHDATHLATVFESGAPTWRHDIYAGYHEERRKLPLGVHSIIPKIVAALNEVTIPSILLGSDGVDDFIATLGPRASGRGFRVVATSLSMNVVPLFHQDVEIYDYARRVWRDDQWCLGKFGIPPLQIADMLALAGDQRAGIPGVLGVGKKVACKILKRYGTVNRAIELSSTIRGRGGGALRNSSRAALLSLDLSRTRNDIDVNVTPKELRLPSSRHLSFTLQSLVTSLNQSI